MINKFVFYFTLSCMLLSNIICPKPVLANNIDDFFATIMNEQNNYQKNSYLLFDCLYDIDAENIDAYSLFLNMKNKGLNVYYALLKNSDLHNKLKEGNDLSNIIIVDESSKKNFRDFLFKIKDILPKTKAIITSFGTETILDKYFNSLPYLDYIFIQHGQIFFKESVLKNRYLYPGKFDYILASSDNETNILKKYGWKDEQIIKSGLPRWDLLNDNIISEKSIFIMFTWRITSPIEFKYSWYYKKLLSLLNNSDFHNYLEENNIKIYFANHHALKTNSGVDFIVNHPNIEMITPVEISKYIKKSSLLITDLSSIAFDFMFQNKPVILYGLDRGDKLLEKNQYIDMEALKEKQSTFPNIFFDENEVIEKIKYYIENDFILEQEITDIYNKFFFIKENIRDDLIQKIEKITE